MTELSPVLLPRTRSCFVCGRLNARGFRAQMTAQGGEVSLPYRPAADDAGYAGIVHGGLAATLMDEVMTWAAILATRSVCVAAEITVRFVAPMRVGGAYRVRGWVSRHGRRLVRAEAAIEEADGGTVARCEGTYLPRAGPATLAAADFYDPLPPGLEWLGGA